MRDAEEMLTILSPSINLKCEELNEIYKKKVHFRLFIILCILAILIPALFVILDISLLILIIPALLTAAAFLILLPILTNHQGGHTCG
jgi:hypothetical protein